MNVVFYIERAYRTPDFGMFERGSKYNNNECELNARYALKMLKSFILFDFKNFCL
jgi:phosphorylase kinase alpha/beta subunit